MRRAATLREVFALEAACAATSPEALSAKTAIPVDRGRYSRFEHRLVLFFRAPTARVQALLPAGWQVAPVAQGLAGGANLLLMFTDRFQNLGLLNILGPRKFVSVVVPGINPSTRACENVVIGGLASGRKTARAPDDAHQRASVRFTSSIKVGADDSLVVAESWRFGSASGERMEFRMRHGLPPVGRASEPFMWKCGDGEASLRWWMIEADRSLLPLRGDGLDWIDELVFEASGPTLAPLFEGIGDPVAVIAEPLYSLACSMPTRIRRELHPRRHRRHDTVAGPTTASQA